MAIKVLLKSCWNKLKQRYLTWKTGKTEEERAWIAWYEENVVYRASTIENMFMHFKHVIKVSPEKFFQFDPFTWVPCEDAKQYFWPQRELGNNAVWRIERVRKDQWDNRWHLDEMGGSDSVFVATNSEKDAIMISLKYAS